MASYGALPRYGPSCRQSGACRIALVCRECGTRRVCFAWSRERIPSIVSVNSLPDYPLVVNVAMARREALANWAGQAIYVAAGEFVAAIALIMLFGIIGQQFRRAAGTEHRVAPHRGGGADERAAAARLCGAASDWLWSRTAYLRFVSITAGTAMIGPNDRPYVGRQRWEMVQSIRTTRDGVITRQTWRPGDRSTIFATNASAVTKAASCLGQRQSGVR